MQLKDSKKIRAGRSLRIKGYTLIEMAISLMIVGLLAAPAMAIYSNYTKTQMRLTTVQNIQTVLSAIQSFRQTNGIYPCPAPLNVGRGAASYGQDMCQWPTAAAPTLTATAPATGACANGICVEASTRVAVPAFTAFQKRVVVGAIPFREMQIDEKSTYDGYGSRLMYVLTQSMDSITTLNTSNGGISVQGSGGSTLINPPDSAVFLILSPGPDRKGGWTADGAVSIACAGAGLDSQNCNPGFEGGAATANPLYIDTFENTIKGANHFDDQMSYFQEHTDPLWRYTPTNSNNVQDLSQSGVGVGLASGTAPAATLDVSSAGGVTTTTLSPAATDSLIVYGSTPAGNAGQINATNICDTSGNCFSPATVAGGALKCPAGQYMSGISANGPVCLTVANVFCSNPALPVMNGFLASGAPNCVAAPLAGCGATTASICTANDIAIPALNNTQTSAALGPVNAAAGGCRTVKYTCNAGVLSKTTDTNPTKCSFTSTSTAVACDCATQLGSGFTGTCTGLKWSLCAGGFGAPIYTTTGCACPGGPVVTHPNCPAPFTGTETVTTTYTAGTCAVVSTVTDTSGCTCAAPNNGVANGATQTIYSSCSSNGYNAGTPSFAQGIAQLQTFSTATCTWTNTGAPVNNCSCVAPVPATNTVLTGGPPLGACPSGYSGTDKQDQIFDSTAGAGHCKWNNSGVAYGCTCNLGTVAGPSLNHDCAADPNYGALDCWNYGVGDATTVTTTNPGCVAGSPVRTLPLTGTCVPRTFRWVNETPTGNTYSGSLPGSANFFGSGCSCNDHRSSVTSPQSAICYNSDTNDKTVYHCDCQ